MVFPKTVVLVAGSSNAKPPRIENSVFQCLRASLKEEITSEITNFPVDSHKGMLKLLKAETGENGREEDNMT